MADAFPGNRLAEARCAELRDRDLARAKGRRRKEEGKIENMKNWSRVEVHTTFAVSHPVVEMINIRLDVGVGHEHALGTTGPAARVDERQNRVRVVDRAGTG